VFHCSTFDLCFIAFPATAVAAVVTCAAAACAAATCAAFVAKVSIGARSGSVIGLYDQGLVPTPRRRYGAFLWCR